MDKRHSFGPSSLGQGHHLASGGNTINGNGNNNTNGHSMFHGHLGHNHSRPQQSLALTFLRILAMVPGFLGLVYSFSIAGDPKHFYSIQQQQQQQWQQLQQEFSQDSTEEGVPLTRSDFWIASM